jgi:methylenetetrahydrofolate dehydrogenase (NADP+)/methenyltetrahydrofolate cyclohydrolase
MTLLLDGKTVAEKILHTIQHQVPLAPKTPRLAIFLVGHHPPSEAYVRGKSAACRRTGIALDLLRFPSTVSERDLLEAIDQRNRDPETDAILVQLPLPPHLSVERVTYAIDPTKDVDGFHPVNLGKLLSGDPSGFTPCTPKGVLALLAAYGIDPSGQRAVIVGRSAIVGKPLAALLMQKRKGANATVTIAHSGSERLFEITRSADILIAALGRPRFITADAVRPGATVIDVGITRLPTGALVGDVDFGAVAPIASAITPVPGGIGPMTVAMLLENTLQSARGS